MNFFPNGRRYRIAVTPAFAAFCFASFTAYGQMVRQANTTLALPESLPHSTGYTLENALGTLTFTDPLDLATIPGVTNRLVVVERYTGLQMVDLDTMTKTLFLDLSSFLTSQGLELAQGDGNGVLGAAFHPQYKQNGVFFVFYSVLISGKLHQRVARFQALGTPGNYQDATEVDLFSHTPLLTQYDRQPSHNGGALRFGPDGYLYISVGDESDPNDLYNNARKIFKDFFGGILRLDVDMRPGNLPPNPHLESSPDAIAPSSVHPGTYLVPADNPWVNLPVDSAGNSTYNGFTFPNQKLRTEWFAIGLRNPWRMNFDIPTGRLFAGDVGQYDYEEVDLVTKGFNGGWSWMEGRHRFGSTPPTGVLPDPQTLNDPIFEYDHNNDGVGSDDLVYGFSITGGAVMRGYRLPELFGKYIFAEYVLSVVAALTENPDGSWSAERLVVGAENGAGLIVGSGIDPRNGDVLFCQFDGNRISRLARTGTEGTPPPALLSQTGAFSDLGTLSPEPGIVSYEPNVSFWSDHAIKTRWFSIPNPASAMTFNQAGSWSFPAGQVWIKHFDLEMIRGNPTSRRKIETRFLVKNTTGAYGIVYKWRPDQTEADLVGENGAAENFSIEVEGIPTNQTWRYPARAECMTCHTFQGGYALSMNTLQLNRNATYGGQTTNLLHHLENAGYFANSAGNPNAMPSFARADDTSQSLEWRMRSYLAVNCAQCHQPGGPGQGYWDARATTPMDSAGLIGGLLVNNGGDSSNRFARAGDSGHSMVLKRILGDGVARMPPLGSSVLDAGAAQLANEWIASLVGRVDFPGWQTHYFGSTQHPDAAPGADPDGDGNENVLEFLTGSRPDLAASFWSWSGAHDHGDIAITFTHPSNRACLVETSTNRVDWALWNVPDNILRYSAAAEIRTLRGPFRENTRYFRLSIQQP